MVLCDEIKKLKIKKNSSKNQRHSTQTHKPTKLINYN
jgi:hypothetical protein